MPHAHHVAGQMSSSGWSGKPVGSLHHLLGELLSICTASAATSVGGMASGAASTGGRTATAKSASRSTKSAKGVHQLSSWPVRSASAARAARYAANESSSSPDASGKRRRRALRRDDADPASDEPAQVTVAGV